MFVDFFNDQGFKRYLINRAVPCTMRISLKPISNWNETIKRDNYLLGDIQNQVISGYKQLHVLNLFDGKKPKAGFHNIGAPEIKPSISNGSVFN